MSTDIYSNSLEKNKENKEQLSWREEKEVKFRTKAMKCPLHSHQIKSIGICTANQRPCELYYCPFIYWECA